MNHQANPVWFGRRYPSWEDLVICAETMSCRVGFADLGETAIFVAGEGAEPPVILVPHEQGLLGHWLLAHEIGHLVQHVGPRGPLLYGKDEAQASRWAAEALIPEARIRAYGNACEDAMIAALSAHYEDLPLWDCPARDLAAQIARIRLRALEEVA